MNRDTRLLKIKRKKWGGCRDETLGIGKKRRKRFREEEGRKDKNENRGGKNQVKCQPEENS